jgi:hypothetical protein
VLDALLAERDPGPDPSGLTPGSTGGPIGKVTLDGIGDGAIVRNLVGEPEHVVVGPIARCSAGCALDLSVSFESLEVRPGVSLRLDWSARVATITRRGGGTPPAAVAITLSTLESSPVATEATSGDIRVTRKAASGGANIVLRLDDPSAVGGASPSTPVGVFGRALTGTATVELSVEVTGSTRRVVIPVNITSPNTMRFPGSGVTVASGSTTRLLATPFQTCSQPVTCEEGISIVAQLSGALVSILSDDETIVVHWTVGVSVSRIGPAAAPASEPPLLTITSTTAS